MTLMMSAAVVSSFCVLRIRPVGEAYRELIRNWHELLPARSTALAVPVMMPSAHPDAPRGGKPPRRFY